MPSIFSSKLSRLHAVAPMGLGNKGDHLLGSLSLDQKRETQEVKRSICLGQVKQFQRPLPPIYKGGIRGDSLGANTRPKRPAKLVELGKKKWTCAMVSLAFLEQSGDPTRGYLFTSVNQGTPRKYSGSERL